MSEEQELKPPKLGRIFFLYLIYLSYIALGMIIFMAIELPSSESFRTGIKDDHLPIKKLKETFLRNHSCLTRAEVEDFLEEVYVAVINNVDPRGNTTPSYKWSPKSALLFSTSVVTTIGFGNITPQTTWGMVSCIAYAVIGIPYTIMMLSYLGETLQYFYSYLAEKLSVKRTRRPRIKLAVGIVLGTSLSILLPAIVYKNVEGWSYLESVYFCFIAISTVGFGDLYPSVHFDGDRRDSGYFLFFFISVLWGMAWIATVFKIIETQTSCFRLSSCRCCRRKNHTSNAKDSVNLQEDFLENVELAHLDVTNGDLITKDHGIRVDEAELTLSETDL